MIQFSKGIKKKQKLDILQVYTSNNIGTYFDCRNTDCKRTRGDFMAIKNKISCKLASW